MPCAPATRPGRWCCVPDAVQAYEHPWVRAVLGEAWHPGGRAATRELLDLAGIAPGARVLDAACGEGATALLLAQRGCQVVGLDASAPGTARARRRGAEERAALAVCRARVPPLPFAAASFDAVVLECALCLLGGPDAFLAEARRVLRPGGTLALADVTLDRPRASFATAAGLAGCLSGALPAEQLEARVRAAGFEAVLRADRSDALRAAWRELQQRVDVRRLAEDFGPVLSGAGFGDPAALVRDVDAALAAGELGYAFLVARAPA